MSNPLDKMDLVSADCAGQIQFAVNLLYQVLVKVIESKLPNNKKKEDFSGSLRTIGQKVKIFFPNPKDQKCFKVLQDNAKNIRNEYCHQKFDINRFEHDIACLATIANLFGAKVVEKKILELLEPVETVSANSVRVEFAEHGYQQLEEDSKNKRSTNEPIWKQLEEEGNNFFKDKKWTDAMNSYTKAIHINLNEASLYYQRALCEIRLSKFQLAREDAEYALALDPGQVKYYRILSEAS
jgi:tetratricopeptide (TPR) repeat protein